MRTHLPWLLALFYCPVAFAELPSQPCAASIPLESCYWQDQSEVVTGDSTAPVPDHNSLLPGRNSDDQDITVGDFSSRFVAVPPSHEGFHWQQALQESFTFLLIEQAYVVHGDFGWVVSENGVPFNHYWRDYTQSLSSWIHSGWNDGDPNWYGYVGHPIQGSLTGFIQIQNDPQGEKLEFSRTRTYWWSRFKAFWWNAAYSTQWNLGPLSEVTVEKYGTKDRGPWNYDGSYPCYRHCVTGVGQIDIVMTPLAGTGWLIGEDFLDKFIIKRIENHTTNTVLIDAVRLALNPTRGGANFLHGRAPWYRASRDVPTNRFVSNQPVYMSPGEGAAKPVPDPWDVSWGYVHLGPPHCQVTVSHTAISCDPQTKQSSNLSGWTAEVEKKYLRHFGAVADIGGQYGSVSQASAFVGIRGSAPIGRFRPFAQVFLGAVREQETIGAVTKSDVAFAEILGAGFDIRMQRRLSWRIEADELESSLFGIKRHNNILSSGPVVRF